MKIIVVSRASDVERRNNITSLLKNSPYDWEFLDAYEADSIPEWFNALYDEKKARRYRSYPLVGGEKGCFSSHIKAWVKCVQLDEPVVVLEDDGKFLPDFFSKIETIKNTEFDYVKLEKRSEGHELDETFMVNKKNRSATTGYYVSPPGAFKFLSSLSSIYMPVDHYIGMAWRHKVAPVGLIDPVITNDTRFGTSIQGDRKKEEKVTSRNKWLRFLRKYRRYIDNMRYRRFVKAYLSNAVE